EKRRRRQRVRRPAENADHGVRDADAPAGPAGAVDCRDRGQRRQAGRDSPGGVEAAPATEAGARRARGAAAMIHRTYFFDSVRYYLDTNHSLTQEQVDGFTALLDYFDDPDVDAAQGGWCDDRMAAYVLATAW